MSNPLLNNNELPPFSDIKAEHVQPAMEELLTNSRNSIQQLLQSGADSWDSLVQVREEVEDRLNQAWSPVGHMNAVVNSEELRQAYNHCLPLLNEYSTEMGQNPALFAAYTKIFEAEEFGELSTAQRKIIDNALRDFRLSGIELEAEQQQRFVEISKQLSELQSKFNDNLLDATGAWSKLIADVNQLKGLPETALGLARQTAEDRSEDGYLLTLDIPSYVPLMTYCDDPLLRREVHEAFATRASDIGPHGGQWDNSAVMIDILKLRKEQARLLGFANFAEQSLAMKTAESTDQVLEFLEQLRIKSRPAAEKEFQEICEFARTEYGVDELNVWDLSYYAEKLKKQKYDVSDEELRPYFPAPRVIMGMFEVVRRLYDIEIIETHGYNLWHEDVTTYDISKDGKVIAGFYLDLYARSKKQGGAWMDECRVRRMMSSGSLQLQFISGHYKTGEPLPDELLEKMLNARNFQSAIALIRQLEFALFDFRLHIEFDEGEFEEAEFDEGEFEENSLEEGETPDEGVDNQVQKMLDDVRANTAVMQAPSYSRFQHAFSHIFGGGYAAGYYSYKWAEVLSADVFAKFSEDGIFNRQTGEKFLSTVLEQGGSRDAMELFVAFRGREPSVDALLAQDGIA